METVPKRTQCKIKTIQNSNSRIIKTHIIIKVTF